MSDSSQSQQQDNSSLQGQLPNEATTDNDPARLCVVLFKKGDRLNRYALRTPVLALAMQLPAVKVGRINRLAGEQGWTRAVGEVVHLTAAGIHVAKEVLDLPR